MYLTEKSGIWVSIKTVLNYDLNDKEKLILSLLIFLSKKNSYCSIENEELGNLFQVTKGRMSKILNSLKERGYIEVIFEKGIRKIIPVAEKILRNTSKLMVVNNYSNSSKQISNIVTNAHATSYLQPLPLAENDKAILNNKNNNKKYIKDNKLSNRYKDSYFDNIDFSNYYAN